MSPDLEGRIIIRLARREDGGMAVQIDSSRLQVAQRLLSGHTPERAVELVGLIFSLCGRAQRVAASAATHAAQGLAIDYPAHVWQENQVLAELALEHAWQLLVNWPQQHGLPPDLASLLLLRQAGNAREHLADLLEETLHQSVLGMSPTAWLAGDPDDFHAWCQAAHTPTAALFAALGDGSDCSVNHTPTLPTLERLSQADAQSLAQRALDEPAWCARPLWHGHPAETGAVARMADEPLMTTWLAGHGRGVGARLLARLIELVRLPARSRQGGAAVLRAWPLAPSLGLAGVETARGLLLHVVRLAHGQVTDYRIVAPTEWNFHPSGVLADALSSTISESDPMQAARRIAHSLDACVAIEVEYA